MYYARFRTLGKLIHRSLKTNDRELAKRRLKDEIEKATKTDPACGKLTLGDLVASYEEKLKQYAEKTIATRQSILNIFKRTWKHGLAVAVKAVTPAHLELWLADRKRHFGKATYNEYVRVLRQIFDLAVKMRGLAESPAAGITELRREQPIRLTPTWEQFLAIVADLRSVWSPRGGEETADLVEFMGRAGVGGAECANLRGEHIDFAAGRISLYRKKTDTGYVIPIFPQVMPLLERLQAKGKIKQGEQAFRVENPKNGLAAACKRLGYPAFTPRSLRRCFITRAVELGVDFKTIAAWQGHRDGGVLIAKTYSHLRSEHSDAMAKKLVAA